MKQKIQWIMINIVTFVLIALTLFLPLFTLETVNGDELFIGTKQIFGFHFVSGYNETIIRENLPDVIVPVIQSQMVNLIPYAMFIMMFIISKLKNVNIGKDVVNFMGSAIAAVYIFLLPIIAPTFLGTGFIIEDIDLIFTTQPIYYLLLLLYVAVFIYYLVMLIINMVYSYQLNKSSK